MLALVLLFSARGASAQQLEPRSYSNIPVGLNFLIAGFGHSSGGLATNPAVPIRSAKLNVDVPVVAYARALDAWGNSAKFDVILPAGCLSGSAEVNGTPRSRDVCGLLDPAFRIAVNFYGAPALSLPEFARYRQELVAGASFQVIAPWGQYDPTRLVNLGANRWTFRPEIGLSKTIGSFSFELAVGASIFTTNDKFFGGKVREQDPVYSTQAHLVYQFRNGAWAALNATYFAGGQSTLDGVRQDDRQRASRLGATFAVPVDRHHSIKLYASTGLSIRTGTDFDTLGMAWQYRWGGGL